MLSEEDNKHIEEQLNTFRATLQEQKKIELYKKFKEQVYEDVKKELTPILEKEIEQRLKEQHFKSVEDAAKKEIENHTADTMDLIEKLEKEYRQRYKHLKEKYNILARATNYTDGSDIEDENSSSDDV